MIKGKGKATVTKLAITLCSVCLLFLILETAIRIRHVVISQTPFFANIYRNAEDSVLGWKGVEILGNPASGKFKVLFVGDSFTAAEGLGDQAYYHVVRKELGIEAFVYAGYGYGTLQEYLVVDRYIDIVKPDLVVLQVCSNDFINNTWELERRSYLHSNYQKRPYYEKGKINYRFPRGPVFLRKTILPYSRLVGRLLFRSEAKLSDLAKEGRLKTVEARIEEEGLDFALFRRSVGVTSGLIRKIQKRCGSIPIVAFTTFDDEPYFSQFKKIFKGRGIDFLEQIPRLTWEAEIHVGKEKERNYLHWGKKGNIACGKHLADYIRKHFLDTFTKKE